MTPLFSKLPEYDPHPDLWNRIEADLDADEHIGRVVGDLPQHEPKADLWTFIEAELNNLAGNLKQGEEPTIVRPLWSQPAVRRMWAGVAAAAIVVLVATWLMLKPTATEQVRVEYAVETAPIDKQKTSAGSSTADQRAEDFIIRQCAEQQLACQRPEVHELRNQLTELNLEKARIEQELNTFGNDPNLVRAQVKVENQRADITKELITLLRS
ncbi:hypothetical protein ACFSUS_17525 [Spirosoma soli]|uniref:Anti-sigma factor n=1 Tax=Spirosoma soli TaxID=1770529 RepID=A0ABW5M7S8_9BACT